MLVDQRAQARAVLGRIRCAHVARGFALVLISQLGACDDDGPSLKLSGSGSVIPLPSAAPEGSAPRVFASSWGLELPRRSAGSRRLVLSRGRLVRLDGASVELLSLKPLARGNTGAAGKLPAAKPAPLGLEGARFGLSLRDGAFLGVGATQMLLLPGLSSKPSVAEEPPTYTPRVSLFPGSQVFADRRRDRTVWVQHPFDKTIYEYDVTQAPGVLLPMTQMIELEDYDQGAFTGLGDGSFVYSVASELRQIFPGGKAKSLGELKLGKPLWRVLPARRIDQLWVADEAGAVQLVSLTERLRVVRELSSLAAAGRESPLAAGTAQGPSNPKPFDIAASASYVARLLVQSGAAGRSWRLVVHDVAGKQVMDQPLPKDPRDDGRATDDWVSLATENFELALSDDGKFIAVGGPDRVTLWTLPGGDKQVLETPRKAGASLAAEPVAAKPAGAAPSGSL